MIERSNNIVQPDPAWPLLTGPAVSRKALTETNGYDGPLSPVDIQAIHRLARYNPMLLDSDHILEALRFERLHSLPTRSIDTESVLVVLHQLLIDTIKNSSLTLRERHEALTELVAVWSSALPFEPPRSSDGTFWKHFGKVFRSLDQPVQFDLLPPLLRTGCEVHALLNRTRELGAAFPDFSLLHTIYSTAVGRYEERRSDRLTLSSSGWQDVLRAVLGHLSEDLDHRRRFADNVPLFEHFTDGLLHHLSAPTRESAPVAAQFLTYANLSDLRPLAALADYAINERRTMRLQVLARFVCTFAELRIHSPSFIEYACTRLPAIMSGKGRVPPSLLPALALEANDRDFDTMWNAYLSSRSFVGNRNSRAFTLGVFKAAAIRNRLGSLPYDVEQFVSEIVNERPPNNRPEINRFESIVGSTLVKLGLPHIAQAYRFSYWADFILQTRNGEVRVACDGAFFHRVGRTPSGPLRGADVIKDRVFKSFGIPTIRIGYESVIADGRLGSISRQQDFIADRLTQKLAEIGHVIG